MKNIKILGESEDKRLIKRLFKICFEKDKNLKLEKYVSLILDDEKHNVKNADIVVLPYKEEDTKYKEKEKLSYSLENTEADFIAINRQEHEDYESFELMTGVEMARIFIKEESQFNLCSVLTVAATLYAGENPLLDVIETLNSILK